MANKLLQTLKHMSGKHNQKKHGRGSAGSAGKGDTITIGGETMTRQLYQDTKDQLADGLGVKHIQDRHVKQYIQGVPFERFRTQAQQYDAEKRGIFSPNQRAKLHRVGNDMDYQNRGRQGPKSGVPDTLETIGANSKSGPIRTVATFKNTDERTAQGWLSRWVDNNAKHMAGKAKITSYQDGDYQDDWVVADAYWEKA